MKVGIVTHNVVRGDGQGRVNYELVRYLLGQGVDIELLCDQVDEELLDGGAVWEPLHPVGGIGDLVKVWDFARRASRRLSVRAPRYDALIACGFVLDVPHTINVAHFVHGTWLHSPYHSTRVRPGINGAYQWVYSTLNAEWERRAFDKAECVVALSKMVYEELVTIGVAGDKIRTIINGVDLEEFRPGPADRRMLRLPEGVPLGLFVGDIRSPIKNLDSVLYALVDAPGVHLAVAGRPEGSPFPVLAEDLGVADRIHFLGFRRDIADLMRAADFFVLPSRRDSCPLVLLEALASALPVLTTRTVGTASLVEGGAGVVVERPDDVAGLAEGLRRISADAGHRAEMGLQARVVAEAHSWERMGEAYISLLEDMAGRDAAQSHVQYAS